MMAPLMVAVLILGSTAVALCQVPYRPPVYSEGLWLPDAFLPAGFTLDAEDRPKYSNPPRSNGSQSVAIRVARSNGTGSDQWIWCFIDGITLHQSVADAKGLVDFIVRGDRGENSAWRRVGMGDEAYIDERRLRGYLGEKDIAYSEAGGFLIKENLSDRGWGGLMPKGTVWRRNLLVDPIRIGRMTVGLRVEGQAITDVSHGKRTLVRPVPTGEELVAIAAKFVGAIDAYARSQGWVDGNAQPGTLKLADSAKTLPPTVSTETAAPPADIATPSDVGMDADIGAVSMGTAAAGALTALGAGIMMLGMGVTPRDVIDGARELFGGASPEATTMEPLTQEQRGAATRILAEGWQDVSSQEQELIRTSPEWLRNALLEKFPAETIKGYEPSFWREGITAGLKAAQSYIDAAVGIYSSATGNVVMGVHYTYWKNMLGGTSEGVADWVWGNNKRGLVRNVAEGFMRGSVKAGVETAVDLAAGKAISNPVAEYVAGQAGKYAVGAAGDVAMDALNPPGSKDRMLRAEGFFDTTSPLEKDVMDALLKPETWATSPARPAPRLPYMAQPLVY